MPHFLFLLLISLSALPANAREWKNVTGSSSFDADYISNDGKLVTLRRNGRILTFSIEKLHASNQEWLKTNHPPTEVTKPGEFKVPEGAAFDTLEFGDTRDIVIKKLDASPNVDGSVAEVMLARVGLNGVYRTKKTIGGLHCHLYFDWTPNNRLTEVTLRTKPLPQENYSGKLKSNWGELIELLTMLHGEPVQGANYPDSDELQDGLILNSHLWYSEKGHSILLGTGQESTNFSVVVRITSQHIVPNRIE